MLLKINGMLHIVVLFQTLDLMLVMVFTEHQILEKQKMTFMDMKQVEQFISNLLHN